MAEHPNPTADAASSQPRSSLLACRLAWPLLVAIAAVVPVLASLRVAPENSPNRDDVAYLSQADALRSGQLTLPADSHDPFFRPFLSAVDDDRVVFKYQPVWPALIALSDAATGTPRTALAITGVASVLAVAALAFEVTRRRRAALLAGYLFACSPWFIIQSGTYLAYPASTALLAGATAMVLRGVRTGSGSSMVGAGALIGLGVFHRPFDAVVGVLPAVAWLVASRGRTRALAEDSGRIALGAAPFAVLFFAYNVAVTGEPLSLAFSVNGQNDRFGFGDRSSLADPGQPGSFDFTPGEAWRTVLQFAGSLPDWLPGGLLAFALGVVGFRAVRNRSVAWLVVAQGSIFPIAYFFWWGAANARAYRLHDLLGPLYWFPLLMAVTVLAGAGIDRLAVTRPSVLHRVPGPVVPVLAVVGLVFVSAVTGTDTFEAVRHARGRQNAEVEVLRPSTGRSTIVIAPRRFEGDLFVPVPVPADLEATTHLIAMDPTAGLRRFELLDEFPDRLITDVLEIHRPNQPFESGIMTRRDLSVRSAPKVELAALVTVPGAVYVRMGDDEYPVEVRNGRISVPLVAEGGVTDVEGSLVVPAGDPIEVAIGTGPFELRWLARITSDHMVELIDPPTPYTRYDFPGSPPVDVLEDVSAHLTPD